MFPDFFERYGGVYGINVKDRLVQIDPTSAAPWIAFLQYGGSDASPYYRYLFHQEAIVDPERREIDLIAGQGVAFTYSYERYYHELREVLTDCRAVSFFEMYDRFGPGFASQGNWARQNPPSLALARAGYDEAAKPGVAEATRYNPMIAPIAVPQALPEHEAMERGQRVYLAQCAVCHGIAGDGKGFLARGLDVRPRDFTSGTYKFRSTASGELPAMADVVRTVRVGVPGTTMPAWTQFLTDEQIHDVARYLVVFSSRFADAWRTHALPPSLPVSAVPAELASLAPVGRPLYVKMQCAACHGNDGRGHGPSAAALKDEWGEPIRTADLTYRWTFKNGNGPEDVYRTILRRAQRNADAGLRGHARRRARSLGARRRGARDVAAGTAGLAPRRLRQGSRAPHRRRRAGAAVKRVALSRRRGRARARQRRARLVAPHADGARRRHGQRLHVHAAHRALKLFRAQASGLRRQADGDGDHAANATKTKTARDGEQVRRVDGARQARGAHRVHAEREDRAPVERVVAQRKPAIDVPPDAEDDQHRDPPAWRSPTTERQAAHERQESA